MSMFGTVKSFDAIDKSLIKHDQWVLWATKKVVNADTGWEGRVCKVPLEATIRLFPASTCKATTWRSFKEAKRAFLGCHEELSILAENANAPGSFGVGFVLTELDGLVGIDLDNVFDPETKLILPWAQEIVTDLDTYTEYSPSKTGLRLFARGDIPDAGRKIGNHQSGAVEMYRSGRFLTVTGDIYHG